MYTSNNESYPYNLMPKCECTLVEMSDTAVMVFYISYIIAHLVVLAGFFFFGHHIFKESGRTNVIIPMPSTDMQTKPIFKESGRTNVIIPQPSTDMQTEMIGPFVHAVSLKAAGGVTTRADEAMALVAAHFDDLLPDDAHEDSERDTIMDDLKRLLPVVRASSLKANLPVLMPKLMRIAEHGLDKEGDCMDATYERQGVATSLLLFLVAQYPASLAPFTRHLEALASRRIRDGQSFGFTLTVSLLGLHKSQGDMKTACTQWRGYLATLKEEMQKAPKHGCDMTGNCLDAVGNGIKQMGAKGVSAEDIDKIRAMISTQLDKIARESETKAGTEQERGDKMERIILYHPRIIASCARLMSTGQEVLGEPFAAATRSLQPQLKKLTEESNWRKEVFEASWGLAKTQESTSETALLQKSHLDDKTKAAKARGV